MKKIKQNVKRQKKEKLGKTKMKSKIKNKNEKQDKYTKRQTTSN